MIIIQIITITIIKNNVPISRITVQHNSASILQCSMLECAIFKHFWWSTMDEKVCYAFFFLPAPNKDLPSTSLQAPSTSACPQMTLFPLCP